MANTESENKTAGAPSALNVELGVWHKVKDIFPPTDKKIIAHWPETPKQSSVEAFVFYSADTGVWYTQNRGFAGNAEAPNFEWWMQLPAVPNGFELTDSPKASPATGGLCVRK